MYLHTCIAECFNVNGGLKGRSSGAKTLSSDPMHINSHREKSQRSLGAKSYRSQSRADFKIRHSVHQRLIDFDTLVPHRGWSFELKEFIREAVTVDSSGAHKMLYAESNAKRE